MPTLQKQLASKAVSSLEGGVLGVIDSAGGMQKMHKAGVAAVQSARLNPQGSLDEINNMRGQLAKVDTRRIV